MAIQVAKKINCPKCRKEFTVKVTGEKRPIQNLGDSQSNVFSHTCDSCATEFRYTNDLP